MAQNYVLIYTAVMLQRSMQTQFRSPLKKLRGEKLVFSFSLENIDRAFNRACGHVREVARIDFAVFFQLFSIRNRSKTTLKTEVKPLNTVNQLYHAA